MNSREPESSILLAIGIIMGVELIGVPLLVVLALSLRLDMSNDPFWIVLGLLVGSAIFAGLAIAKLLRLAKPSPVSPSVDANSADRSVVTSSHSVAEQ